MEKRKIKITSLKEPTLIKEASLVIKQCWQETYKNIFPINQLEKLNAQIWQHSLQQPGRHNLIVQINNKIIGIVSYGKPRQSKYFSEKCGELMCIYILADYQGQGIGSNLMRSALKDLQSEGFNHAALWVEEQNSLAINFYEQKGWQKTGIQQEQMILGQRVNLLQYKVSI